MMSTRSPAVAAGILFLAGTAAGMLSVAPAVEDPNYLRETVAHRTRVILAAVPVAAVASQPHVCENRCV
jgi:hypothetical protein